MNLINLIQFYHESEKILSNINFFNYFHGFEAGKSFCLLDDINIFKTLLKNVPIPILINDHKRNLDELFFSQVATS